MHESVPDEYKPALFIRGAETTSNGRVRAPFPPPTKHIKMPRASRYGLVASAPARACRPRGIFAAAVGVVGGVVDGVGALEASAPLSILVRERLLRDRGERVRQLREVLEDQRMQLVARDSRVGALEGEVNRLSAALKEAAQRGSDAGAWPGCAAASSSQSPARRVPPFPHQEAGGTGAAPRGGGGPERLEALVEAQRRRILELTGLLEARREERAARLVRGTLRGGGGVAGALPRAEDDAEGGAEGGALGSGAAGGGAAGLAARAEASAGAASGAGAGAAAGAAELLAAAGARRPLGGVAAGGGAAGLAARAEASAGAASGAGAGAAELLAAAGDAAAAAVERCTARLGAPARLGAGAGVVRRELEAAAPGIQLGLPVPTLTAPALTRRPAAAKRLPLPGRQGSRRQPFPAWKARPAAPAAAATSGADGGAASTPQWPDGGGGARRRPRRRSRGATATDAAATQLGDVGRHGAAAAASLCAQARPPAAAGRSRPELSPIAEADGSAAGGRPRPRGALGREAAGGRRARRARARRQRHRARGDCQAQLAERRRRLLEACEAASAWGQQLEQDLRRHGATAEVEAEPLSARRLGTAEGLRAGSGRLAEWEELLDQGLQRHGGETPPRARAPPGEGAACGASGATQAVFIRRARSRRFTPTELPGEP
ncbi:unnamed protein product [Prorocentrum cordatum]|uniref:Uncharacterized protein n=1 Tax=Prorocentrum cordatum TaxID=2364126 RepID=A0ABN9PQH1_9DINO|nr:unnamed protein product [Polarella glacialis]